MGDSKQIINTGLRGVTVASTRISHVDGEAGKLIYRGYPIFDLSDKTSFEEIVHLLLYESLPDKHQLKALNDRLIDNRAVPENLISALKTQPAGALPMDILQTAIPMLANMPANKLKLLAFASDQVDRGSLPHMPG